MKNKLVLAMAIVAVISCIMSSCQSEADLNFKRYYSAGTLVYQSHCQNCHAAGGEGLGALIPPLTDSTYLKNKIHQLPCLVKNGIAEVITVNGKNYSHAMPAQQLTPIEIAQVLTYVGNSFGNRLGVVDEPQVSADVQKCE